MTAYTSRGARCSFRIGGKAPASAQPNLSATTSFRCTPTARRHCCTPACARWYARHKLAPGRHVCCFDRGVLGGVAGRTGGREWAKQDAGRDGGHRRWLAGWRRHTELIGGPWPSGVFECGGSARSIPMVLRALRLCYHGVPHLSSCMLCTLTAQHALYKALSSLRDVMYKTPTRPLPSLPTSPLPTAPAPCPRWTTCGGGSDDGNR